MEKEKLIQYLQDIVTLETQKRIAGKTYNEFLIIEKDYQNVKGVVLKANYVCPSILRRLDWVSLIMKIIVGFFIEGMAALFLKWSLIFALMMINIEIDSQTAEIVSFLVCVLGGNIWIVRDEVLKAQNRIAQELQAYTLYREKVKTGKIILAQIQENKPELKKIYGECDQNLKKLYDLNVIHSNYHSLEACGMFLQYLKTGRTHCLEQRGGDVGAYNLYENDLKYKQIKTQLDQVLRNQQILYGVLNEINNNVNGLCESVRRIEQHTQQTAYNTKVSAWCNAATAMNIQALKRMQENYILYQK